MKVTDVSNHVEAASIENLAQKSRSVYSRAVSNLSEGAIISPKSIPLAVPTSSNRAVTREPKTLADFYNEDNNFFKEDHLKQQNKDFDHAQMLLFPNPVNKLTVPDWDDTMRPEQPINFSLTHNAVASAANAQVHAATPNPDLEKLALTLEDYRTNHAEEQAARPMKSMSAESLRKFPWIAMVKEQFIEFAMNQELEEAKDFRPAIIKNMIDNIHVIAPVVINLNKESRNRTFQTIYAHFQRQYDELSAKRMRIEARAELAKYRASQKDAGKLSGVAAGEQTSTADQLKFPLPFPDVKLESNPGAKKYMETPTKEGEVRILQSNRRDKNLRDELYTTGMDKHVHYATGTPMHTFYDTVGPDGKKAEELFTPVFKKRMAETEKTPIYDLKGKVLGYEVDGPTQQKIMNQSRVEQMHRKDSPILLRKAIQDMKEIGVVFAPELIAEGIGDTTKDIKHLFPLLENNEITELIGTFVNHGRHKELQKLIQQAKEKNLNVSISHHNSIADAFAELLGGDRSTEPFAIPGQDTDKK